MDDPNADLPDDLIPVKAGAALAQATRQTLYQWVREGRLVAYRRCGRTFVSRSAVLGLFERVEPPGRKPAPPRPASRRRQDERTLRILERFGVVKPGESA